MNRIKNLDDKRNMSPPEMDLSNLTEEEIEQLKKVLQKQEQFENEIEQSIR